MNDRTPQGALLTTEEANQFARDFTERTERAALANANVIANQAETLGQMWHASADIASSFATRSADQAARTFGFGDDAADKVAGQTAGNVEALAQSASVLADSVRAISTELVDFVRHSTERSIDHMAAVMRCRSPQDFVTAHSEALRDNMEMVMDRSRRIAEIAMRTAEESSHVIGRNLKPIKPTD